MSAFIVETSTLNAIVSAISGVRDLEYIGRRHGITTWPTYVSSTKDCVPFFRELEAMNARALTERYGDEAEPGAPVKDFHVGMCGNIPATIKALECYLYQCSEGTVPQCALYKAMKDLQLALAMIVVRDARGYEQAAWR